MARLGPERQCGEPHEADAAERERGGARARREPHGRADGRETQRLAGGRRAAARRDAAELRGGEGERQRGERGVPEARAPRRDEEQAGGRQQQAAGAGERRAEREAGQEARAVERRARAERPHRDPERRAQRSLVERRARHVAIRLRAVWRTWSADQNR